MMGGEFMVEEFMVEEFMGGWDENQFIIYIYITTFLF